MFGVEAPSTCQQEICLHALPGQSAREQRTCSPFDPEGDTMSAGFWVSGGGGVASKTGGRRWCWWWQVGGLRVGWCTGEAGKA